VRQPVGERLQAQVVYFLEVVGRVGKLAEDLGVVEVGGTVLGRDVLKGPDRDQEEQDQAGDQPVQQAKTGEPGGAELDGSIP
jgi:hypothetical protein